MAGIVSRLRYLTLKRPFSRKINLRTDDMLTASRRERFLSRFAPLRDEFPLVATVAALAHAYGGDCAKCHAVIDETIMRRGFAGEIAGLYSQTDLRKFLLDCFRDYFDANETMPRPMAEALFRLARDTDDQMQRIYDMPSGEIAARAPIPFAYMSAAPTSMKVRIYCRSRFFGANSRPHDLGVRIRTAFAEVANCVVIDPASPDAEIEACDLALVDDVYLFRKDARAKRRFLEELSRNATAVGLLELDPWMPGVDGRIARNRDLYDFVWTMAPTMAIDGKIAGLPACVIPLPVGCPDIFDRVKIAADDPSLDTLRFCGGVEEYNLHRYFWVLAGVTLRRPFSFCVTNHKDDGLSAVDSLSRYAEKLSGAYAALNFTMRKNGQRAMVGRTFDCLRLGQLLVQEYCADMRCYFAPGAHFLEFRCVADLEKICDELSRQGRFEAIRRDGAAYFAKYYSDAAVLRHLGTFV